MFQQSPVILSKSCHERVALKTAILLSTVLLLFLHDYCEATPVTPPNNININCPVPTTSTELGTSKVLHLDQIKGNRVRLQFFYPREDTSRRSQESSIELMTTNSSVTDATQNGEAGSTETVKTYEDIFCQWTFRAGNESQFLSLTFEKLSAPYSDNCAQAFVALQKENGYESRWCGNRRQANARPMSLLAKSSAMITVYRSGDAPLDPATGFKVAVRELDAGSLQGAENTLRVLYG